MWHGRLRGSWIQSRTRAKWTLMFTRIHTRSKAELTSSRAAEVISSNVTVVVTWLTRPEAVYNKDARRQVSVISARWLCQRRCWRPHRVGSALRRYHRVGRRLYTAPGACSLPPSLTPFHPLSLSLSFIRSPPTTKGPRFNAPQSTGTPPIPAQISTRTPTRLHLPRACTHKACPNKNRASRRVNLHPAAPRPTLYVYVASSEPRTRRKKTSTRSERLFLRMEHNIRKAKWIEGILKNHLRYLPWRWVINWKKRKRSTVDYQLMVI